MTRIRTDLPLISDKEMEEWAQDIVENTHYRDLKTLRMKLDQAIESHDNDLDLQPNVTSAN
ncbi:MAG TPA: hypothetical protein VFX26_00750 [Nitrososphaeraceae archaeon]|jgi:hypothetical protein|nr:hypothetical protein [Nitrososphaeraceae archaeon]